MAAGALPRLEDIVIETQHARFAGMSYQVILEIGKKGITRGNRKLCHKFSSSVDVSGLTPSSVLIHSSHGVYEMVLEEDADVRQTSGVDFIILCSAL